MQSLLRARLVLPSPSHHAFGGDGGGSSCRLDCDALSFFLSAVVAYPVRLNRGQRPEGGGGGGGGGYRRSRSQVHAADVQAGGSMDPWNGFGASASPGFLGEFRGASAGLVHRLVASNKPYNALAMDLARCLASFDRYSGSGGAGDYDSDNDDYEHEYYGGPSSGRSSPSFRSSSGAATSSSSSSSSSSLSPFASEASSWHSAYPSSHDLSMHPVVCELVARLVADHWLSRCVAAGCGGGGARAAELAAHGARRDQQQLLQQHFEQQQQQQGAAGALGSGPGLGFGGGGRRFQRGGLAGSGGLGGLPSDPMAALPAEIIRAMKEFTPPTLAQVHALLIVSARLLADPRLLSHVEVHYGDGGGEDGGYGGDEDEDYGAGAWEATATAAVTPPHHPVAILLAEMGGFLCSCFNHLKPAHSISALRHAENTGAGSPTVSNKATLMPTV